jgi:hypothetical protein
MQSCCKERRLLYVSACLLLRWAYFERIRVFVENIDGIRVP